LLSYFVAGIAWPGAWNQAAAAQSVATDFGTVAENAIVTLGVLLTSDGLAGSVSRYAQ
jgi:hypothetical protein